MAPASSEISFVAHPPERGSRLPTGLFCGCSCCCCCCLHTVGGVIGAVRAAKTADAAEAGMMSEPSPTGEVAEASLKTSDVGFYYWGTVAALIGLSALGSWSGVGVALLLLPGLQLMAALLVAAGVAMGPRDLRPAALRYLWKVTLGTMAGTALGIVAMGGIGLMLMGMK